MRDFSNGGDMNVNGDLIINDHSQNEVGKPLIQCTSEYLIKEERPFRQENLRLEKHRKIKNSMPVLTAAVIVIIGSAVWAHIKGDTNLVTLVVGIGALLVGCAAIKGIVEPNQFEIQEQNAIREINNILKSRRAE
ncbi:DUF6106 family protein [Geobacter anodireducens]|uniref:Uncharacterized protein n=1 Tax=Geobacter anodireducens TaxID=1340425 RepID=A0ABR9NZM4_9BACT|nr:DUF6106 family protein [Geobacter anodireducens]MBE2889717.1 hypothetical protein [Geobacter anodireducens]